MQEIEVLGAYDMECEEAPGTKVTFSRVGAIYVFVGPYYCCHVYPH